MPSLADLSLVCNVIYNSLCHGESATTRRRWLRNTSIFVAIPRTLSQSQNGSISIYKQVYCIFFAYKYATRGVGLGWEVMDWQKVTNFDKSVENELSGYCCHEELGVVRQCGTAGNAGGL